MPITPPIPIDAAPTVPSSSTPEAIFDAQYEAFNSWEKNQLQPGVNAIATNVFANATDAAAAALAASGYVATVAASAAAAAQSATSAASVAGAAAWLSGATYVQGDCVWSPTSFLTYRRRTNGAGTIDPASDQTNWQTLASSAVSAGYIHGFTLSNNSSTNKIDVAVGYCADSTNTTAIAGTAFTKSIAGAWVAGSNVNGMGVGLTVANNTWYHVFAIIAGGAFDVYFDTSASAANKPAGTTAFRRIGSFRTSGSAQIIAFKQYGQTIYWTTAVQDVNTGAPPTAATLTTLSVPVGVSVYPICHTQASASSGGGSAATFLYSPFLTTSPQPTLFVRADGAPFARVGATLPANQLTNTSAQLFYYIDGGLASGAVTTYGWVDPHIAAVW